MSLIETIKAIAPLSAVVTAAIAAIAAAWTRKRDLRYSAGVLRQSMLAQLEVMAGVIDGELEFVGSGQEYTWFPVLSYSEARDSSFGAGVLSPSEVKAIAEVAYTYQERVTYMSKYGELQPGPGAPVCTAIGIDLVKQRAEPDGGPYLADLRQLSGKISAARQEVARFSGRELEAPLLGFGTSFNRAGAKRS